MQALVDELAIELIPERCLHDTRCDAVDVDPVLGELAGGRLAERRHRPFRSAVVCKGGVTLPRGDRAGVDELILPPHFPRRSFAWPPPGCRSSTRQAALTFMSLCQPLSVISRKLACSMMPALLNITSSWPKASTVLATRASTSARFETSTLTAMVLTPPFVGDLARHVFRMPWSPMSATTTLKPRSARPSATP